jgi:sulfur-carrier protein
MATVWIPAQLRTLSGGQDRVDVVGSTVGEVIDALDCLYPGMKARLCDENGLRRGIAVAVDSLQARLGLLEVVEPASEVHFIPAIAGGAD